MEEATQGAQASGSPLGAIFSAVADIGTGIMELIGLKRQKTLIEYSLIAPHVDMMDLIARDRTREIQTAALGIAILLLVAGIIYIGIKKQNS